MNTSTIVQKLWNYCNVLRDDAHINTRDHQNNMQDKIRYERLHAEGQVLQ